MFASRFERDSWCFDLRNILLHIVVTNKSNCQFVASIASGWSNGPMVCDKPSLCVLNWCDQCTYCHSFLLFIFLIHFYSLSSSFIPIDYLPHSILLIIFLIHSYWLSPLFISIDYCPHSLLLINSLIHSYWLSSSFIPIDDLPH